MARERGPCRIDSAQSPCLDSNERSASRVSPILLHHHGIERLSARVAVHSYLTPKGIAVYGRGVLQLQIDRPEGGNYEASQRRCLGRQCGNRGLLHHLLQQCPPIREGVEECPCRGGPTWSSSLMSSRRCSQPRSCDDECGWPPAAAQTCAPTSAAQSG